jgi:hypothetical protein
MMHRQRENPVKGAQKSFKNGIQVNYAVVAQTVDSYGVVLGVMVLFWCLLGWVLPPARV